MRMTVAPAMPEPYGAPALRGRRAVDGQADDHGIVTRQDQIDDQHLGQDRPQSKQCVEIHGPST